jgi:aryl-alcohol dehydrogenase-like predicted oxidoreductase
MMKRRRFGRTGLEVTSIALGGWPFGVASKSPAWDPFAANDRKVAITTVHEALDRGNNYIDTAPSYGDGNSESIIGEVMATRRDQCVLATKTRWRDFGEAQVVESVHESLRRLKTDRVDVIQFHGGVYTAEDREHLLNGGPLAAFERLRADGKVRFLGLTAEEPFSVTELIRTGRFDVIQMNYNFVYQASALHVFHDIAEQDMGVVTMRSMTSGILEQLVRLLVPGGEIPGGTWELALKYLLCDSRVHVANIGMRWPEEVRKNVDLVERFVPPIDLAELPRSARGIYKFNDESVEKARAGR